MSQVFCVTLKLRHFLSRYLLTMKGIRPTNLLDHHKSRNMSPGPPMQHFETRKYTDQTSTWPQ